MAPPQPPPSYTHTHTTVQGYGVVNIPEIMLPKHGGGPIDLSTDVFNINLCLIRSFIMQQSVHQYRQITDCDVTIKAVS